MDFKWLLVCSCCVRNKGEKNCQKAFSCKNNAIRRLWRKNSAWGISRKLHLMKQAHCGFKWIKSFKIKFTLCDFINFSKQVPADSHNFRFRSLHAICQTVRSISVISSISRILNPVIGRFLPFGPTVRQRLWAAWQIKASLAAHAW